MLKSNKNKFGPFYIKVEIGVVVFFVQSTAILMKARKRIGGGFEPKSHLGKLKIYRAQLRLVPNPHTPNRIGNYHCCYDLRLKQLVTWRPLMTSPSASGKVLPCSSVISLAISFKLSLIRAWYLNMICCRASGEVFDQA